MKATYLVFSTKSFHSRAKVCVDSIEKFSDPDDEIIWHEADESIPVNQYVDGLPLTRLQAALEQLEAGAECVISLGADCVFYGSIKRDIEGWRSFNPYGEEPQIMLCPHVLKPLPVDSYFPSQQGLYRTGHANADFVVFYNSENTKNILRWLINQPMVDKPAAGIFYEQTWLSALPFMFPGIGVIQDPGYNVAYFNYHENRDLSRLKFIQFSGYVKGQPEAMSRYQTRWPAGCEGALLEYYKEYDRMITE